MSMVLLHKDCFTAQTQPPKIVGFRMGSAGNVVSSYCDKLTVVKDMVGAHFVAVADTSYLLSLQGSTHYNILDSFSRINLCYLVTYTSMWE